MALIISAQSGNFNLTTTWVGGIIPTIGDEAQAQNTHSIQITGTVSCTTISNIGSGTFTLNNGATLNANVVHKSANSASYTIIFGSGVDPTFAGTINGNLTGGSVGGGSNAVSHAAFGTLTINGNITGGTITGAYGLSNTSQGVINVTGNITGGTVAGASGLFSTTFSNGRISVTGNITSTAAIAFLSQGTSAAGGSITITNGTITGGTAASIFGISHIGTASVYLINSNLVGGNGATSHGLNNNSTAIVSIIGNCTAGTSTGHGFNNASTGSVTIFGNCLGATSTSAYGVNIAGIANVSIIGNCTGGGISTAFGLNNATTGVVTISGSVIGGIGGAGVINAGNGSILVTRAVGNGYGPGSVGLTAAVGAANTTLGSISIEEIEYGTLGMSPTSGAGIRLKKLTSNVAKFNYCDTAGSKTLVDATQGQMPAITNVRFGISYASGALTGVAYIPSAGSVATGVPVDNTVGTATLTAQNVRDAIGLATANLDTQLAAIPTAITNAAAVRTNLTSELTQITEVHKIHGLDIANALTVTPTLRSAGAITQAITGNGTTSTIVTRV